MQQVILGIGNAVKWVMGVLLIVSFLNVMPNVVMPSVEVPTYSITSVKKFYSSDPPIARAPLRHNLLRQFIWKSNKKCFFCLQIVFDEIYLFCSFFTTTLSLSFLQDKSWHFGSAHFTWSQVRLSLVRSKVKSGLRFHAGVN